MISFLIFLELWGSVPFIMHNPMLGFLPSRYYDTFEPLVRRLDLPATLSLRKALEVRATSTNNEPASGSFYPVTGQYHEPALCILCNPT